MGQLVQQHDCQHQDAHDQKDAYHADDQDRQGSGPGRKMKHTGASVKSDALARSTLQNAKKEA